MIKYILVLIFSTVLIVACEQEEGEEIKADFTNDNIVRLLVGDTSKNWLLVDDNTIEFDDCIHTQIYQFKRMPQDTSQLLILQPRVLCDPDNSNPPNDTLATYQWVFQDTLSTFRGTMILYEGDSSFTAVINEITPVDLRLFFGLENEIRREFVLE